MSKLKTLNKETVSMVLLHDVNLPEEVIGEIVEIIWRSDDRLEEIQRANTGLHADRCLGCGAIYNRASSTHCAQCGTPRGVAPVGKA